MREAQTRRLAVKTVHLSVNNQYCNLALSRQKWTSGVFCGSEIMLSALSQGQLHVLVLCEMLLMVVGIYYLVRSVRQNTHFTSACPWRRSQPLWWQRLKNVTTSAARWPVKECCGSSSRANPQPSPALSSSLLLLLWASLWRSVGGMLPWGFLFQNG